MLGVSTSIILDTRRVLKDGTYPVKIRVTFQRKQKYYPTEFSFSPEDFKKLMSSKPGKVLKEEKLKIQAVEQNVCKFIEKLPEFSFYELDRRLLSHTTPKEEVFSLYDVTIAKLRKEGRLNTATSYEVARNSIWSFAHGAPFINKKGISKNRMAAMAAAKATYEPLPFSSITVDFLRNYEKWMLKGGRSITTVGFNLRTLRALFNEAIASGDVNAALYPFGKRKYQIPSGVNVKKALSLLDIEKIFSYSPTSETEAWSRDLWLFSYLCNGINVKDMARLKYQQLDKDTITFIRAKTESTMRHQVKSITAVLSPQVQEIIDRWGNRSRKPDAYIFSILSPGLTPEQELRNVKQATQTINKYIMQIADALGIEKRVTTYTARHSFSTVLKRAGVSTAFISESLGHASEKTTQSYLDSFESEAKRDIMAKLTDFKG